MGYANIWIHNNVFYNSTHRPWTRGYTRFKNGKGDASGSPGKYRADLPSYFYNNTVIDVVQNVKNSKEFFVRHAGIIHIQPDSQSPDFIANNIFDYGSDNGKRAIYASEDKVTVNNNLYTNKQGYYTGDENLSDNKSIWFRYTNDFPIPKNEIYMSDPKFVNQKEMVFVPNIGPHGVYMPNFNLQTSSPAKDKAAKIGNDPTGRSIDGFDILGNKRDSHPDIGAFEYIP